MNLYLDGKVDPVAALGKRELDFIPKHFHCVSLTTSYIDLKPIRHWIWKNQNGRFCLGNRIKVTEGNHMQSESVAAFEDAGEAVMFSFILPTLKTSSVFDDI